MELKKGILSLVIVTGIACSIHAQDYTTTDQTRPERTDDDDFRANLYHACEFSIDGSAVGVLHAYDFNSGGLHRDNYRFGGDAGANFFFTKYIGIGADAYAVTGDNPTFVQTVTGNLIFRVPIGNTGLAPYVFGGAGYHFERVDGIVGGGGVGLEIRVVRHFSIFADARYLASVKTPDFGYARVGVRISF
jgi:hypothetical protein